MRSANQMQPFGIDRAHAGPFVNVLTISGPVENGAQERLVVVSGDNPTVKPFVGDPSLPGLEWFETLPDAMVELLGNLTELGDWPPPRE
jgi:hypothetical protein